MNASPRIRSTAVITAAVLLASFCAAPPAAARPEPQPTPLSIGWAACPLERIGTQYVRCDDLTGLGAPAPKWVPQQ